MLKPYFCGVIPKWHNPGLQNKSTRSWMKRCVQDKLSRLLGCRRPGSEEGHSSDPALILAMWPFSWRLMASKPLFKSPVGSDPHWKIPPKIIQLWESDVNPCQMAEYGTLKWCLRNLWEVMISWGRRCKVKRSWLNLRITLGQMTAWADGQIGMDPQMQTLGSRNGETVFIPDNQWIISVGMTNSTGGCQ